MRITEIDLQCNDIMWFGIDKQNHLFECTSAGCGNVPEFVCKSKEDEEFLSDYFLENLEESTQEKLLVEYNDKNQLLKDCIRLSRKGIYCFDIFEEDEKKYVKLVEPLEPISYNDLPQNIKDRMRDNRMDVDVAKEKIISVEHAYK